MRDYLHSHIDFVEKNDFGEHLDMSKDIFKQLKRISGIEIETDILIKKGLILESKISDLISFYKSRRNE